MPKKISEELKKQLVKLYNAGRSVQSICEEYKISKSSLYNWVKLYSEIKTEGKLVFTGREVYLLQKEVTMLKEENEILKSCDCSVNSPISIKIREVKKLNKGYSIHALSKH